MTNIVYKLIIVVRDRRPSFYYNSEHR